MKDEELAKFFPIVSEALLDVVSKRCSEDCRFCDRSNSLSLKLLYINLSTLDSLLYFVIPHVQAGTSCSNIARRNVIIAMAPG